MAERQKLLSRRCGGVALRKHGDTVPGGRWPLRKPRPGKNDRQEEVWVTESLTGGATQIALGSVGQAVLA